MFHGISGWVHGRVYRASETGVDGCRYGQRTGVGTGVGTGVPWQGGARRESLAGRALLEGSGRCGLAVAVC